MGVLFRLVSDGQICRDKRDKERVYTARDGMKELQDKTLGRRLELVGMRSVRKEEGWIWTRGVGNKFGLGGWRGGVGKDCCF